MNKLYKMISDMRKIAQFAEECPKGKRGRPLSPGSVQRLGDENICEKKKKDGGSSFYKKGSTVETEKKAKAERQDKSLSRTSTKEAKIRLGLSGKKGRLSNELKEKIAALAGKKKEEYKEKGLSSRAAIKNTKSVSQLKKVSEIKPENIASQIEKTKDFGYAKNLALEALKSQYSLPEDFDEVNELEAVNKNPKYAEMKDQYEKLKSQYAAFTQEFIMSPQGKSFVDLYKKQLNDEVLQRTNEKAKALKAVKNSDLEKKDPTMYESVVKELSKPVTLSGLAEAATSVLSNVGTVLGIGAAAVAGGPVGTAFIGAGFVSQLVANVLGAGGEDEGFDLNKSLRAALSAKTMGAWR